MKIQGECPMGCGPTLWADPAGYLRCANARCPDGEAAHSILADGEHEHLVYFVAGSFTIRHPLRERLHDDLLTCDLHEHCHGRYQYSNVATTFRARRVGGVWTFEALSDPPLTTSMPVSSRWGVMQ